MLIINPCSIASKCFTLKDLWWSINFISYKNIYRYINIYFDFYQINNSKQQQKQNNSKQQEQWFKGKYSTMDIHNYKGCPDTFFNLFNWKTKLISKINWPGIISAQIIRSFVTYFLMPELAWPRILVKQRTNVNNYRYEKNWPIYY